MTNFFIKTLVIFLSVGFTGGRATESEVELVCMRKNNATNQCYYNFKVNGVKYNYVDPKCKGKKDDVVEKARDGKLALAREWKIKCPGEDN